VAKHVRILERAGLLRQTREGRHRLYELDPAPLRVLDDWIGQYRTFWQSNLRSLKRYVERQ
jgi:DNA-binding transcriptional ArsR family regulator